jgi:hypothetical protein
MKLDLILNQTSFIFLSYENGQTEDFKKPKKTDINFTLEAPLKTRHHRRTGLANREDVIHLLTVSTY